jgi:hypothetical protein
MNYFRQIRNVFTLTVNIVLSSSVVWAAEGIISKIPDVSGSYCHLRFPAIREETLSWNRPVLKDPREGDIIDFYGPCDHDPLGNAEILRQKADWRRFRDRIDGETD